MFYEAFINVSIVKVRLFVHVLKVCGNIKYVRALDKQTNKTTTKSKNKVTVTTRVRLKSNSQLIIRMDALQIFCKRFEEEWNWHFVDRGHRNKPFTANHLKLHTQMWLCSLLGEIKTTKSTEQALAVCDSIDHHSIPDTDNVIYQRS